MVAPLSPTKVTPWRSPELLPVSGYAALKGLTKAVSTSNAELTLDTTGYRVLTLYSPSCDVLCRQGTSDATVADGGWDFVIPLGCPIDVVIDTVNTTALNFITPTGSGNVYVYPRK